ncbi:NAD-dependent epimerase/dehydratase family protein [Sphingomonas alba]|uniref:NAD(P)-dependent oxidoreductase n=1 Tax=Sphingomonas alba TaxID=2908208 RepID=A0ABT0RPY3_9SPHN|nr:NAD(P)-dependent oxidoreductase [Sphingomonas alba]MCL6684655.1 NAD(P)-dependent oxidoreductase [Sphingomonas alba]
MVTALTIALTGGTGFVGGRVLDLLEKQGASVRALTRRPLDPRPNVEWVDGALDQPESLYRLVERADAVIHVAGAINAPTQQAFDAANLHGTEAMIAAAKSAGVQRFIHVSSLAAREPQLSQYGASKAKSEAVVEASGLGWSIVRPPAVYGPGDKETFDLFKMARRGQIFMPPKGRVSLIHVDDLARLLVALAATNAPTGTIMEPDDGRAGGWSHIEFGNALGEAVGVPSRTISTPRILMKLGSKIDGLIRRDKAKLTADRVAYFCHPDWVANPALAAPAELWRPEIDTRKGLKATAEWYSEQRWH